MKYLVAYILISFVAIGVLGFAGLTSHESLFSQCVTATIPGGMPCTDVPHSYHMNILHAQIFQSFTFAILAAMLLLMVSVLAMAMDNTELFAHKFVATFADVKTTGSWEKYNHWLTLYQQHPGHA